MKKGFTLIEIILYLGLASTMILVVSLFFVNMVGSRIKQQAIAEVEQQGVGAMHRVMQTVRNATVITSPTQGASSSSLTITVPTTSSSPTMFDLSGGAIRLTEGTGSPITLTNSRVTASAPTFQNLSRTSTPGTVRIQFTLTHVNPTGRNEYEYSKTFYGSASLR